METYRLLNRDSGGENIKVNNSDVVYYNGYYAQGRSGWSHRLSLLIYKFIKYNAKR